MSTEKESENKPLDMDVRLKSALSIGDEVKIKRFTTNTVHLGNISKFLEKYVEHEDVIRGGETIPGITRNKVPYYGYRYGTRNRHLYLLPV